MLIRLSSMELTCFKNVRFGKIAMPASDSAADSEKRAGILGIYGQNGSGKTAVTDMLSFLKIMLSGDTLPPNVRDYITRGETDALIKCSFTAEDGDAAYRAEYSFTLSAEGESPVAGERLAVYNRDRRRIGGIEYSREKSYALYPRREWKLSGNAAIDAEVEKRICLHEGRSVIFSDSMQGFLFGGDNALTEVVRSLRSFARSSFYIIRADSYTKEDARIEFVLPSDTPSDSCEVKLKEPTVLADDDYNGFLRVLDGMNTVLGIILPGFRVELHEFGREIMRDGEPGMRFELMTGKNGMLVPIRYESEGIKKIISVINLLIGMYNNYQMCVVIDELDSGVFEFLLGELLSCIEESGKGQLVFTSHNLRPLEMIDSAALVFTTTNPDNRYIRIREKTKNLRSTYLRHITLGGLNEEIYAPVNTPAIAQAFRKCRRETENEQR